MKKSPSYFINNSADAAGGAIYANKFNTDVYYASFINNHAGNGYFNYDGGAVYIFNEITLPLKTVYLLLIAALMKEVQFIWIQKIPTCP